MPRYFPHESCSKSLGTCSDGALKSQGFESESRPGTGDTAVAEEAAYQTGLDTNRLMCPPKARHATENTPSEGIKSNRDEIISFLSVLS